MRIELIWITTTTAAAATATTTTEISYVKSSEASPTRVLLT